MTCSVVGSVRASGVAGVDAVIARFSRGAYRRRALSVMRTTSHALASFDARRGAHRPESRRQAPPALRCAHPVVRFSITANSSYMIIAIAPITTRPPNASPICIDEPAEISR